MSDFISELKAAWVGARQREFHQGTRGIMTPEDRRALEEEFDQKMAQIQANAWYEGHSAGWESRNDDAAAGWVPSGPHESDACNPYRKGQGNE